MYRLYQLLNRLNIKKILLFLILFILSGTITSKTTEAALGDKCIQIGVCGNFVAGIGGCDTTEYCKDDGLGGGYCEPNLDLCVQCSPGGALNECGFIGGCGSGERCSPTFLEGYKCQPDNSCAEEECTAANGTCSAPGCNQGQWCQSGKCELAPAGQCGNPSEGSCNRTDECGSSDASTQCNVGEVCNSGNCQTGAIYDLVCGENISCTANECGGACSTGTVCNPLGNNCVEASCGQCGKECSGSGEVNLGSRGELCPTCQNELGDPKELLSIIYRIVLPVAIVLGVFLISICGYKVMTSHGDPSKLNDAKECVTSAIIGMLFILLSASILRLVINSIIADI